MRLVTGAALVRYANSGDGPGRLDSDNGLGSFYQQFSATADQQQMADFETKGAEVVGAGNQNIGILRNILID